MGYIAINSRTRNLTGLRFARLVCLGPVEKRRNAHIVYECVCDCGAIRTVTCSNLKSGHTTSCGCAQIEITSAANSTHGQSKTQLYRVWTQMKQRCNLPTTENYKWYGARGIKVCQRWMDSFEAFRDDMGPRPRGHEIDRINNNGNYENGNCRWVPHVVNMRNSRRHKGNQEIHP